MLKTILTAVIIYLASSIDEIPVLFMLYTRSSNRGKVLAITTAYFTGTFVLIGIGLLGAFGLVQIPVGWAVGLIGLVPVAMGIKILLKGDDDEDKAKALAGRLRSLFGQVFIITLALGADDLGVYIPLFATTDSPDLIVMLLVFGVGTVLLCLVSNRLTTVEKLTGFIEKRERFIIGIVFILVGIMALVECRTLSGVLGLFH